MTQQDTNDAEGQVVLVAIYEDEAKAQHAVEKLGDKGVALDMLSVLGRVHASGDDVLGIYYTGMGSRVEAWAKQGALWGALWGLLAGAAAMFVLPVVGPIFAAAPSSTSSLPHWAAALPARQAEAQLPVPGWRVLRP